MNNVIRRMLDEPSERLLSRADFQGLTCIPAEVEWFANIDNPRTKRAYEVDLADFSSFVGISQPREFRVVTRAHVIAWRKALEGRKLAPATIRRKLSALSSIFEALCEANAVTHNPVNGVRRPREGANEGKTPAIANSQIRALLNAPDSTTLKGKRDRAILCTFVFHGIRCSELAGLTTHDVQERRGVNYLRVLGKGSRIRYVPAHPRALESIHDYLKAAGHGSDAGPLFRPVKNPRGSTLLKALTQSAIYRNIVCYYAEKAGIEVAGFCTHALRATAATNALENSADIAKVQEWLGHASIATTKLYDRRQMRPEDSPTFNVDY